MSHSGSERPKAHVTRLLVCTKHLSNSVNCQSVEKKPRKVKTRCALKFQLKRAAVGCKKMSFCLGFG